MELLNLLMRCQRMYLICFIGQAVGLIFCSVLLQRRRSIFKLAVFTAIKSIIVVTSDLCLSCYYPEEDWAKVFSMFISTFGSIATCMMFVYTYYGGALKCVLGTVFAELVTGIVMLPSIIIVNAAEGRSDLFLFYGDFEILDWMLIGVVGVLGVLLYKVSASFLRRFRTYSIRYKYLLWGMIAVYVAASQWMAIIDIRNDRAFMAAIYFLFLGGSLFVLAALILIFRRYKNSVRNRNDFLHLQMELIASQYASLLGQMKYIEQCQNMIDWQISEVTGRYADSEQYTVADTYLKHLKKEYNAIRAGIYCKDWLWMQFCTARWKLQRSWE